MLCLLCSCRVLLGEIRRAQAHQEDSEEPVLGGLLLPQALRDRARHRRLPPHVARLGEHLHKTNAKYVVRKHRGGTGAGDQVLEKEVAVVAFPSPLLLAPVPGAPLLMASPLTLFFVLKPAWLASGAEVRH